MTVRFKAVERTELIKRQVKTFQKAVAGAEMKARRDFSKALTSQNPPKEIANARLRRDEGLHSALKRLWKSVGGETHV